METEPVPYLRRSRWRLAAAGVAFAVALCIVPLQLYLWLVPSTGSDPAGNGLARAGQLLFIWVGAVGQCLLLGGAAGLFTEGAGSRWMWRAGGLGTLAGWLGPAAATVSVELWVQSNGGHSWDLPWYHPEVLWLLWVASAFAYGCTITTARSMPRVVGTAVLLPLFVVMPSAFLATAQ